jgi:hypothetical protein
MIENLTLYAALLYVLILLSPLWSRAGKSRTPVTDAIDSNTIQIQWQTPNLKE